MLPPGPSLFTQPADRLRRSTPRATSRRPRGSRRPNSYGSWRSLTDERIVDDAWVTKKPKWEKYRGLPISFLVTFRR